MLGARGRVGLGKRSQRRHGASESRRRILCRAQLLGRCSTTPMSGRHHDGAALKEQPHLSTSTPERGAKISHSQPLERCRVSTWDVKGGFKKGGVPFPPFARKRYKSRKGEEGQRGEKPLVTNTKRGKNPGTVQEILRRGNVRPWAPSSPRDLDPFPRTDRE